MVVSDPSVQLRFAIWLRIASIVLSLAFDNTEVFIAELQDTIKGVIPLIVKSLKNKDRDVQFAGADAIGKVAGHGK